MRSASHPPIIDDAVYVVGAGAQTPVGRSVLAAGASVRGGLSSFAEHPFMLDAHREPMIVARAGWLAEDLSIEQRIATLARDAARQSLSPLRASRQASPLRMSVHLALAAETQLGVDLRRRVVQLFAHEEDGLLAPDEVVAEGHAGGLLALRSAVARLRAGDTDICLIGGADSWMNPASLSVLDRAGLLRSQRHTWGFTPGEGAGFCLITTGSWARRLGLKPHAEICAVATALEAVCLGTDGVCLGEGLSAVLRGVLDDSVRVTDTYCDLNGEMYRADEYGFTLGRFAHRFDDPGSFTAAASSWGDVGAASGLLSLTLALAAWARSYARGANSLVWSSGASHPLRAAVLLRNDAAGGVCSCQ